MLTHNEMIIRNLKNNAIEDFIYALEKIGDYNGTEYAPTRPIATDIINKWYEAKKPLIEMFSNHPTYNREYGYILLSTEYDRPKDYDTKNSFLWWFNSTANLSPAQYGALCDLLYPCAQYVETDGAAEVVKQVFNVPCSKGAKVMKTINKIAAALGMDKCDEWGAWRAKLGDAITPQKLTRPTTISVNPVDFLYMSTFDSFRSCYNLENGEYSGGVMNYLLDTSTVILSTYDDNIDAGRAHVQSKISRQLFHIGEEKIIQSRFYNGNDYEGTRALVQRVYAECNNVPNYWILKRGRAQEYAHINNIGYVDILHSYDNRDHGSVSFLAPSSDYEINENHISVGVSSIICPNCGTHHRNDSSIMCESCAEMYDTTCEYCGRGFDYDAWDTITTEDGNYYCCAECAEADNYRLVDGHGWYYMDDVVYCEYVEGYIFSDEAYIATDGTVFDSIDRVWDENYVLLYDGDIVPYDEATQCEDCGEWFYTDDITVVDSPRDSRHLCGHCLRREKENGDIVECPECGGLYFRDDCDESVVEAGYCSEECATAAGYVVAGVA